ncbi:deoxyribodipyrimidine photo-lyase [Macrosteles quadrilineatus]|uniref:deoxyribodipyrimidine photo-lyase n=1 Tax=Macrosteles quadrilineatus TaxID=74068 RepID=UPI0023E26122|nr:deoxyribodipyrimidine photo-lyase [Macrosteles quadrilineatus]XP_054265709.1 deoxyribodipyrimidine photo-lyase [Macrosteles quadrilineatus]XP_054265710.1 deoxyribodipyrimidine photo-lyase [Macrosteles quadrilineatus]
MASEDEPALKKVKTSESKSDKVDLISEFEKERKNSGKSILDFKFNKKRVRILSPAKEVPDWAEGIVYWMFRDERVQDNWALLFAQKLAMKNEVPLHVCFCRKLNFLEATIRHYKFLLDGLKEVETECKSLNIEFHLLIGNGEEILPGFMEKNKLGALVLDFMPLRSVMSWADQLKKSLPKDVPLCQVDAHNIVPCWTASDKLEYGARTIRGKITRQLPEFLTGFPAVAKHPYSGKLKAEKIDWEAAEETLQVDRTVGPVSTFTPGYKAAIRTLDDFCNKRIRLFGSKRNDPTINALSNLSPYFHFGQLSVQRAILHVKKFSAKYKESVDAFVEEAVIRRELSDNFCFYNKNYDNISGAYDWAKKTLNDHRKDKRQYVYNRAELEESKTHDDLWNAAQIQLVKEGKMHGFLRMYWAKKILEWTATPEDALANAIYFNDRYSMDGRDPSGYVGCMWSICGIHDQGWRERDIFGKIRYMNYEGCKRKFDVAAFVARYGGKVHKYVKK